MAASSTTLRDAQAEARSLGLVIESIPGASPARKYRIRPRRTVRGAHWAASAAEALRIAREMGERAA